MSLRLKLIKKIAERVSEDYSIEWEQWSEEECEQLERTHGNIVSAFEELLEEDPDILDGEGAEFAEHFMDSMLNSYIITSILQRKRHIEEVIRQSSL